jgi:LacI family transcriptional regulator
VSAPRLRNIACCLWLGTNIGQETLTGICQFARQHPYWNILRLDIRDELDLEHSELLGLDGAILQPFTPAHAAWIKKLRRPVVVTNQRFPGLKIPVVSSDEERAGRQAAEFFLQRGYRHFGFAGRLGHPSSDLRKRGFVERLRREGFDCSVFEHPFVFEGAQFTPGFQPDAAKWLRALPAPVAILAFVDAMGASLMELALQAGRRVPEEIAILGIGNDPVSQEFAHWPLSSIELANRAVGFRAASLLAKMLEGAKPPSEPELVPPLKLHERQSTDVFAVNDPAVRRALEFIRANLNRALYVKELAQVAGLSRRPLEKRFRTVLGVSPHAEINRLRAERAKDMLRATTLKMEEIASLCGFEDGRHLSLVFKRMTGLAPRDFRRRNACRR